MCSTSAARELKGHGLKKDLLLWCSHNCITHLQLDPCNLRVFSTAPNSILYLVQKFGYTATTENKDPYFLKKAK